MVWNLNVRSFRIGLLLYQPSSLPPVKMTIFDPNPFCCPSPKWFPNGNLIWLCIVDQRWPNHHRWNHSETVVEVVFPDHPVVRIAKQRPLSFLVFLEIFTIRHRIYLLIPISYASAPLFYIDIYWWYKRSCCFDLYFWFSSLFFFTFLQAFSLSLSLSLAPFLTSTREREGKEVAAEAPSPIPSSSCGKLDDSAKRERVEEEEEDREREREREEENAINT